MIVARAYLLLDRVASEVSCVHTADPLRSHLLIRELSGPVDGSGKQLLRALANALDMASFLEESASADGRPACAGDI